MLGRDIDGLFEHFFGSDIPVPTWQPSVDVFLTGDKLHVLVELPGVGPDDVQVTVAARSIVVRGTKRQREAAPRGSSFYQAEIPYGDFEKRVALPFVVDPESVEVELKDGVLRLAVMRARINVRVVEIE